MALEVRRSLYVPLLAFDLSIISRPPIRSRDLPKGFERRTPNVILSVSCHRLKRRDRVLRSRTDPSACPSSPHAIGWGLAPRGLAQYGQSYFGALPDVPQGQCCLNADILIGTFHRFFENTERDAGARVNPPNSQDCLNL